jgi:hypothetical protein
LAGLLLLLLATLTRFSLTLAGLILILAGLVFSLAGLVLSLARLVFSLAGLELTFEGELFVESGPVKVFTLILGEVIEIDLVTPLLLSKLKLVVGQLFSREALN